MTSLDYRRNQMDSREGDYTTPKSRIQCFELLINLYFTHERIKHVKRGKRDIYQNYKLILSLTAATSQKVGGTCCS